MLGYWLVFSSAFLAATLLPFYSELSLVTALSQNLHYGMLWLVATAGNSLGAVVNWVLGRFLHHYRDARWFPFKERGLKRAEDWFSRYGVWSLLLSWLPVGGDALTFIAGLLRVHFLLFLALVVIGKGARYLAVILLFIYFY